MVAFRAAAITRVTDIAHASKDGEMQLSVRRCKRRRAGQCYAPERLEKTEVFHGFQPVDGASMSGHAPRTR